MKWSRIDGDYYSYLDRVEFNIWENDGLYHANITLPNHGGEYMLVSGDLETCMRICRSVYNVIEHANNHKENYPNIIEVLKQYWVKK